MSRALDSTGSVPGTDEVDFRVIAQTNQGDTFRDFVKDKQLIINPMLAWRPTQNARFYASFEYVALDRLFDNGLPAIGGVLILPDERFLGEPDAGKGRIDS